MACLILVLTLFFCPEGFSCSLHGKQFNGGMLGIFLLLFAIGGFILGFTSMVGGLRASKILGIAIQILSAVVLAKTFIGYALP
jgi:hypothetical protein